jgi:glycerol uptake facilitator protein
MLDATIRLHLSFVELEETMPTSAQIQRFLAEALGTFLLVFIGAGAISSGALVLSGTKTLGVPANLLLVALALGFGLFLAVVIAGRVSGAHVNPAVTVGLASAGQFPWRDVPLYVVGQVVGAVLGALAIPLTYGRVAATVGSLGAPSLAQGMSLWQGALVEGIGTAILVLTVTAAAVDSRAPAGWGALAIGLALAAIVMVIGTATGGSVNPARAFGPDLVNVFFQVKVNWSQYLVAYLIGPLVGGIVGANLYAYIARLPRANQTTASSRMAARRARR